MLRNATMLATCVAATTLMPVARAQSAYSIVDVGLPPGRTNVTPKRLSPDGRAIVYSTPTGGGTRSYLWSNGVFQDLGSYDAALWRNEAADINSSGQIAGSSWGSGYPARAWRLTDGAYSLVPTLGGQYANAYSISDNGLMTGWAQVPLPANFFAYLYDGARIVNLGELPGSIFSTGYAVNSDGVVACDASAGAGRSWMRAAIAGEREGMQDLGTLGGAQSFVHDINTSGHVVGYSDIASNSSPDTAGNTYHAFLWREGVMTDLGRLPGTAVSVAYALNDFDVVVGASRMGTDWHAAENACRWAEGQIADLNTLVPAGSGYAIKRAVCVNNAGQILASAMRNNQARVVILTPVR